MRFAYPHSRVTVVDFCRDWRNVTGYRTRSSRSHPGFRKAPAARATAIVVGSRYPDDGSCRSKDAFHGRRVALVPGGRDQDRWFYRVSRKCEGISPAEVVSKENKNGPTDGFLKTNSKHIAVRQWHPNVKIRVGPTSFVIVTIRPPHQ